MMPSRWKTAPSAMTSASVRLVTFATTYFPRISDDAMPTPSLDARVEHLDHESLRAVQPIAGVSQAGDDVAVRVEVAVDGRRVHGDVRMVRVEVLEPLGTRQETEELDRARPRRLETRHGRHRRVAGGEHRIDDDGVAITHVAGHLEVVLDGGQRLGIPVEADVPHAGAGDETED